MISKLKLMRGLVLVSSTMLLGACGGMNGFVTASPEAEKVVAQGGYSEDALAQIAIVQNPDYNGGKLSFAAFRKIQQYAISCQKQVGSQLAGAGKSAVNGALPLAAAGAGLGLAADQAWGAAVSGAKYATAGVITAAAIGVPIGLREGSYALVTAVAGCTEKFWEDIVKTDPAFKGTHIVPALAGKSGNPIPPALNVTATVIPTSVVTSPSPASAVPTPEQARKNAAANKKKADDKRKADERKKAQALAKEEARMAKVVEKVLAAKQKAEEAEAAEPPKPVAKDPEPAKPGSPPKPVEPAKPSEAPKVPK